MLRLIFKILGDYATTLARSLVVKSRLSTSRFDKANLPGKRFAACLDLKLEPGEKMNLDDLKLIAGDGDFLPVERKGRDLFDAALFCKVFAASNEHIPVDSFGESERRRFHLVPCNAHVEEPDPQLEEALQAEYPQILSLLIEYAVAWNNNGRKLPDCKVINAATNDYFEKQDILGQFLADCCVLGADLRIPRKELFNAYEQYLFREQGISKPGKIKNFAALLEKRGISEGIKKIEGKTARIFEGVILLEGYTVTKKPEIELTSYRGEKLEVTMNLGNSCNLVTENPKNDTKNPEPYISEAQKQLWLSEEAIF